MRLLNYRSVLVAIVFSILSIPYFMRLDVQPIRQWDEARMAVNALEMSTTSNIWVTTFQHQPDMWSTKPPLMIWIQALFIKVLGPTEIAIRLPAALAAFLTMILVALWVQKITRDNFSWLWAAMALTTSQGFLGLHTGRTGDFDALLTLFITLAAFSTYSLSVDATNKKWLWILSIAITGAIFTKGVAGAIVLPMLFLWLLFTGNLRLLLTQKSAYFALLIPIVSVLGFYFLREHYNPGYIARVWENEIGGRYTTAIEGHEEATWFYLENLISPRFKDWIWLSLAGAIVGLFNAKTRKETVFVLLVAGGYFMVISTAKTKLFWYDMPLFPFLAILVGFCMAYATWLPDKIKMSEVLKRFSPQKITISLIAIFFLYPSAQQQITQLHKGLEHDWDVNFYNITYYLRQKDGAKDELHSGKVLHRDITEASAYIYFYTQTLRDRNCDFRLINTLNLNEGDTVFAHTAADFELLENNPSIKTEVLESALGVRAYRIMSLSAIGQ